MNKNNVLVMELKGKVSLASKYIKHQKKFRSLRLRGVLAQQSRSTLAFMQAKRKNCYNDITQYYSSIGVVIED